MMIRKWISFLLALAMVFSISACGAEDPAGDGQTANTATSSAQTGPAPDSTSEIPPHILAAMDRSNQLTTGKYYIADDDSILVFHSDGLHHQEYGPEYAAIPDLKELIVSCSGFDVFALTETGDLYFHNTKVEENIADFVFNATNVSERGFYTTTDRGGNLTVTNPKLVNSKDREAHPEAYIDLEDQVIYRTAWNTDAVSLAVEHDDFIRINSRGGMEVSSYNDDVRYALLGCLEWTDLILVDASKWVEQGEVKSLTVAGLQSDGTVLACGDYAEEILSWGPLSYLSMSAGAIVGLTTDGRLKMTGEMAEFMAEEVETWTDIAAVKVGNDSVIDTIISAVTTDGTFYCVHCNLYNTYECSDTMVFSTERCSNLRHTLFRYCADGTAYRTVEKDGAFQWEVMEPGA